MRKTFRTIQQTRPKQSAGVTKQVFHIGTAGWAIPARYSEALPGSGSHLERYARKFNAVEINSSFHRHHRPQTYVRWAASVAANFRFAVKVPRTLTHEGELTAPPEVLDSFVEEIAGLGDKLGVLLVQLPPKLAFDQAAAVRFFRAVRKRIDVRIACEPRHPTWGSKRADKLLASYEVARVAADPAPWLGAGEPGGFQQLAYFRWHGHPRKYYSDYGADRLASLRDQIAVAGATESWIIFDNTVLGCATGNAMALQHALGKLRGRRSARSKQQTTSQFIAK